MTPGPMSFPAVWPLYLDLADLSFLISKMEFTF